MNKRLDRQGIPKLGDDVVLQEKAERLSELLAYYASLLSDPQTTALEIHAFAECDIEQGLRAIYSELITDNESVWEKLRQIDPEIPLSWWRISGCTQYGNACSAFWLYVFRQPQNKEKTLPQPLETMRSSQSQDFSPPPPSLLLDTALGAVRHCLGLMNLPQTMMMRMPSTERAAAVI